MAAHDPILILLVIIIGLLALGAARGRLETLRPGEYRRDFKGTWRWKSGDYRICTYCEQQTTTGYGPDDTPMCNDCKSDLLP